MGNQDTNAEVEPSSFGHSEDLQRFVELGRLSASLLHEISNPLAAALIHLEQVTDQKSINTKALKRCLVRLVRYVNAARQQLGSQSDLTNFYIDTEIKDIKRLVMPLAKTSKVKLIIDNLPHIKLRGDPIKFQQVLVNLIVNAIEAYQPQSKLDSSRIVRLSVKSRTRFIVIDIVDRGEGIASERIPLLFEPFYTTKSENGHGLGLGLVIVRQYVDEIFGGSIKVTSSEKNGTKFSIRLPGS